MIRPVLKMGEELLLEKAMPVKAFGTPELRRLVVDMWDTMDVEGGIGIAAPQVGVSLQVICFGTKESERSTGCTPESSSTRPIIWSAFSIRCA